MKCTSSIGDGGEYLCSEFVKTFELFKGEGDNDDELWAISSPPTSLLQLWRAGEPYGESGLDGDTDRRVGTGTGEPKINNID